MWALSRTDANRVAAARGLRETIEGGPARQRWEMRVSVAMRRRVLRRNQRNIMAWKMHAVTHLAHLAIAAEVVMPLSLFRDDGLVHEAAHLLTAGGSRRAAWVRLARKAAALEGLIPGYLSPAERRWE